MKLIIAGSRHLDYGYDDIDAAMGLIRFDEIPDEVVCGGAAGVDEAGKEWAYDTGTPLKMFEADWETHGKAAGPVRNKQMAEYGDALLLIWDGQSRGSANMKKEMKKLGKPIYEIIIKHYYTKEEMEER